MILAKKELDNNGEYDYYFYMLEMKEYHLRVVSWIPGTIMHKSYGLELEVESDKL